MEGQEPTRVRKPANPNGNAQESAPEAIDETRG